MANETNKSKKASKMTKSTIAMIVCLAVIGVLILTTILLAVIPTDKGVKFAKPDQMVITYDGQTAYFESNSEEFKQIWEEYEKAGKQPVIATLFGGYANKGMKAEYGKTQDYSQLGSSSSSEEEESTTSTNFVIKFVYNDSNKQTMKNGNGTTYEYENESKTKLTFEFTEATFEVTNDNAMQTKTFYLKSTLDSDTSTKTHITYTGVANFNSLYELLKSMVENNKFIS